MTVKNRTETNKVYIGEDLAKNRIFGGLINDTIVIHHVSTEAASLNPQSTSTKLDLKTPYYYPFVLGEYFLIRDTSDMDEQNRWRRKYADEPDITHLFLKIDEIHGAEITYTLKYEEIYR